MNAHANIIALFCDDLRQEQNNRITAIGIYPDNLMLPQIPIGLAKICVYVRAVFDPAYDPLPVRFRIETADGESIPLHDVEPKGFAEARAKAIKTEAPLLTVISGAEFGGFMVRKAGKIRVFASVQGKKEALIGFLNIDAKASPTASALPAKRSPSAARAKAKKRVKRRP